MGAYLTGFHRSTKSTPQIQFWGVKTDFGALVTLSLVPPKPPPECICLVSAKTTRKSSFTRRPWAWVIGFYQKTHEPPKIIIPKQGYDSTTFCPRFSHVPKAYSGLDLFFAAILIFLISTKSSFGGLKLVLGHLLRVTPLLGAYLTGFHPPPKSSFGGLKLVLGHLFRVTPLLVCISHSVPPFYNHPPNPVSGVQNWICKRNDFRCDTKLLYMTFASETKNSATFSQLFRVVHWVHIFLGCTYRTPKPRFEKSNDSAFRVSKLLALLAGPIKMITFRAYVPKHVSKRYVSRFAFRVC